jgi:hypothetical protein
MKLKTDYCVTITLDEAGKALAKFVEKKTGKKVTQVAVTTEGEKTAFLYTLQGDESDLDKENA